MNLMEALCSLGIPSITINALCSLTTQSRQILNNEINAISLIVDYCHGLANTHTAHAFLYLTLSYLHLYTLMFNNTHTHTHTHTHTYLQLIRLKLLMEGFGQPFPKEHYVWFINTATFWAHWDPLKITPG